MRYKCSCGQSLGSPSLSQDARSTPQVPEITRETGLKKIEMLRSKIACIRKMLGMMEAEIQATRDDLLQTEAELSTLEQTLLEIPVSTPT